MLLNCLKKVTRQSWWRVYYSDVSLDVWSRGVSMKKYAAVLFCECFDRTYVDLRCVNLS